MTQAGVDDTPENVTVRLESENVVNRVATLSEIVTTGVHDTLGFFQWAPEV